MGNVEIDIVWAVAPSSLEPVIKDGLVCFALAGFTPVAVFNLGNFRFLVGRTCGLMQRGAGGLFIWTCP